MSAQRKSGHDVGRAYYDRDGKHEYVCTGVDTLLQLVTRLHRGPRRQLWYRGHADASWQLVPSVFRRRDSSDAEPVLIEHFVRAAPIRYAHCPAKNDRAAWLQLMQHYRLPTRLLDWTQSPLVALFFAVE